MGKKIWICLFTAAALALAAWLLVPGVAGLMRMVESRALVQELELAWAEMDADAVQKQKNLALWYNLRQWKAPEETRSAYDGVLDFGDGVMGYLVVPDWGLYLPLVHEGGGRDMEALVHRAESDLPAGTGPIHTAFSTDVRWLKMLAPGDRFEIHVLDQVYSFWVREVALTQESWDGEETLCTIRVLTGEEIWIQGVGNAETVKGAQRQFHMDRQAVMMAVLAALATGALPLLCRAGTECVAAFRQSKRRQENKI